MIYPFFLKRLIDGLETNLECVVKGIFFGAEQLPTRQGLGTYLSQLKDNAKILKKIDICKFSGK
jgi:hypothetical protein